MQPQDKTDKQNQDSEYLLTELLTSLSAPLTVVMLTVERLKPGEELSEADHQLLLQNLDRINKAVKWSNQARGGGVNDDQ